MENHLSTNLVFQCQQPITTRIMSIILGKLLFQVMSIFLRNSFFNYAKSSSSLPGTEIVSNWRHLPDGSPVYARAWRPSCLPGACILLLVCLFLTGLKRRRRCVDSLPLFLFIIVPSSLFTAFKARCCIFTITDIDHRSDHPSDSIILLSLL
ncbi:hypothetical protein T4B_9718 [Trichinella pseudospiralis]|uniref:Transmembrane protein n=1 Tax=Trichinella pseudospiralis TaxID=6337 RepID=A0A0V1III9_TRIPS|nr:hypothetical protein T4B_9718 [Trichinella pseudospiralis]